MPVGAEPILAPVPSSSITLQNGHDVSGSVSVIWQNVLNDFPPSGSSVVFSGSERSFPPSGNVVNPVEPSDANLSPNYFMLFVAIILTRLSMFLM